MSIVMLRDGREYFSPKLGQRMGKIPKRKVFIECTECGEKDKNIFMVEFVRDS